MCSPGAPQYHSGYDIELDEFDKPYFTMELLEKPKVLENFDSAELRQKNLPQLLDVLLKFAMLFHMPIPKMFFI